MLTLGIDPGTATLGWGLVEENGHGLKQLAHGCVKTSPKSPSSERLGILFTEIRALIRKHKPDQVAVEKLFFGKNAKTAISVGEARGVVLLAAHEEGVPIAEYTPLQVKIAATGYGRAEKCQVQQMVKNLLKLECIPKPDDAADALAVAICHLNSVKMTNNKCLMTNDKSVRH
jgi:crossover junction endodeoxyribonuclease RuvC